MPLIQVLIVLFAAYALSRAVSRFRAGELALGQVAVWAALWVGVGIVAALPQTASIAAAFVGVGRGVDLVMYCALIALFYATFRMFVRQERMERELTALVRAIALRDAGLAASERSGTAGERGGTESV